MFDHYNIMLLAAQPFGHAEQVDVEKGVADD